MGKRLLSILVPIMLLSCGESREQPLAGEDIVLMVTDTIGVETGEESLTFGFISGTGMTPGGSVAVLDAQKATIQVFSTQGTEILRMGGLGSGPGEFRFPVAMAVLPDGFAVSDLTGGKVSFFNGDGECVRELYGFFPVPPLGITGSAAGAVIGTVLQLDTGGGDRPSASMVMASWTDSTEPDVVFHTVPVRMEGGGATARPRFNAATGSDGSVYFAEESDSLLLVLGFTGDGAGLLTISEGFQRIPRSDEEMAEEFTKVSLTISNGESNLERTRMRREEAYRTIVEDIGVDSLGRIWLKMGHTGQLHFRVYSRDGSTYSIASPDDPQALARSSFSITPYGFTAHEPDPEDWPKVYVLDPVPQRKEVQQ